MRTRLKVRSIPLSLGPVLAIAVSHVAVLAFLPHPAIASNCLQLLSALLAFGLCLQQARRSTDRFFRYTWVQLGAAFAIWSTAQSLFLRSLFRTHLPPPFPSIEDMLWLLFAFPILMVTVTRRTGSKWEWVNWLDSAQACVFFFLLNVLAFSHSPLLSFKVAYDVQAAALFMCGAIRYSSSVPGQERIFFRFVLFYLSAYSVLTLVGIQLHDAGTPTGSWVDVCWNFPFLIFCTVVIGKRPRPAASASQKLRAGLPKHLHGLSALGLAVLSILAGGALETHYPIAGGFVLAIAFLLFAVRTSARELQLQAAHDTLQHSAFHDSLTSLANRAQLRQELARRLEIPSPESPHEALFFIDLDRFKTINDGLSHAFGDQLLIAIAQVLRSMARERGDFVARLGGDEFVVLARCTHERDAQNHANALLDRLRQPILLDGRVLHTTASIGVVLAEPGLAPDELMRNSNCAMHVAKQQGKNQAKLFHASMIQKANDKLWLETDLREAIDSGGISVEYQPIYSLSEHAIVGFEALARWRHPTRGMVSPAVFIPVAEETGLVLALGKQVLHKACKQVEMWNRIFGRDFTVSVNVSVRQFADANLLDTIQAILAETRFPANRLKLEITESVLLSGVQTVEGVLNAARRLGIEISLDDFGTGYSSLSYLLRFPFDVVKIDRSFIQSLDGDPQRANLAEMIVQLAIRLGKRVIAEGVERDEERQLLEAMRCDLLQGYLFSKPLAPDAVELLLDHWKAGSPGLGEESSIWRPGTCTSPFAGIPRARPGVPVWELPQARVYSPTA